MTKAWGPLGWATLHSVAALYPDNPSELEKKLITKWLESFRQCIVCDICKNHFSELLRDYKVLYPNWNASRKDLTLFALRAHNTVNVRQLLRRSLSIDECFTKLEQYVNPNSASGIRKSYIVYIRLDWSKSLNFDGITAAKYIKELIMVETDYWSSRPPFTWAEIRNLVNGENIEAISGSKPIKKTIFNTSSNITTQNTTQNSSVKLPSPSNKTSVKPPPPPNGKPRFSFLSR
jgi:hypothetical protein